MIKKITLLFLLVTSTLLAQQRSGSFVAGPQGAIYPVSGTAALQFLSNGTKRVVFNSDFSTIQGLRLEVFLSTSNGITSGSNIKISTQQLQDDNGGTDMSDPITGFKIFDVPSSVNINDYSYIVIQCTQASVLWGSVALGVSSSLDVCERSGNFVAGPQGATYPISGSARIEFLTDGTKQVLFDNNFDTDQGLQLEVFLSKTGTLNTSTDIKISTQQLQDDNGGTDLGDPITGYKRFVVPANVDLEEFDNVIIQCTSASILWGRVQLSSTQGSGCAVLSVDEEILNSLTVYPNPVQDILNIDLENESDIKAEVYSLNGQQLIGDDLINSKLDLSLLKPGFYILVLRSDNNKTVRKIQKI